MSSMLRQKNNEIRRKRGDFLFLMKRKLTSKKEVERLVEIYLAAFDLFKALTPCVQCYSRDEIKRVIKDQDMIKFIVYCQELAIGLGLATANLKKVPWINPGFYQNKFRVQMEQNSLFYFKGIAMAPEFQNAIIKAEGGGGVKIALELFSFMANFFPIGSMIAFDCSENANSWLCDAIMTSTGCFSVPLESNGKNFVDRQIYHIIRKSSRAKSLIEE